MAAVRLRLRERNSTMKLTKKQLIERWTPEIKEAIKQRWETGVIGESPFGLTDEGRHDLWGSPS